MARLAAGLGAGPLAIYDPDGVADALLARDTLQCVDLRVRRALVRDADRAINEDPQEPLGVGRRAARACLSHLRAGQRVGAMRRH